MNFEFEKALMGASDWPFLRSNTSSHLIYCSHETYEILIDKTQRNISIYAFTVDGV